MARYVTAAYVFDRGVMNLRDEDAQFIDQLNYSFALVKDGAVSGAHWSSIEQYKTYIARHPHILPVVSVGGWGCAGGGVISSTRPPPVGASVGASVGSSVGASVGSSVGVSVGVSVGSSVGTSCTGALTSTLISSDPPPWRYSA